MVPSFPAFLLRSLCATAATLAITGCNVTRAHYDATNLRDHATAFYQRQVVENVVRGSKGMLFVQVDLGGQTSQTFSKLNGTVNGGQSLKNTHSLAGTALTLATEATRPFTFSVTPEISDQITSNTNPIVGKPEAYAPYIRFLNLRSPKQRLADMPFDHWDVTKPPGALREVPKNARIDSSAYVPGTLITYGDSQYYIDSAYRQAYFDMCLALMARPDLPTPKGSGTTGVLETQTQAIHKLMEDTKAELQRTREKVQELQSPNLK